MSGRKTFDDAYLCLEGHSLCLVCLRAPRNRSPPRRRPPNTLTLEAPNRRGGPGGCVLSCPSPADPLKIQSGGS